jgi:hypothetical protein
MLACISGKKRALEPATLVLSFYIKPVKLIGA